MLSTGQRSALGGRKAACDASGERAGGAWRRAMGLVRAVVALNQHPTLSLHFRLDAGGGPSRRLRAHEPAAPPGRQGEPALRRIERRHTAFGCSLRREGGSRHIPTRTRAQTKKNKGRSVPRAGRAGAAVAQEGRASRQCLGRGARGGDQHAGHEQGASKWWAIAGAIQSARPPAA